MKRNRLRTLAFSSLGLITAIMMVATVVEKQQGSDFVREHIYGAWWMVALWGASALLSLFYIIKQQLYKQLLTFALHLSFLLILAGAGVTYLLGIQGRVHLRVGENATGEFALSDGQTQQLPFSIQLQGFELQYYEGTFAPMDYVSHIEVLDGTQTHEGVISMNNIFRYRGYRFYQSGYDRDGKGTSLAISYDPYGIGITYSGYAMLLATMLAFFFQRGSTLRRLLRHPALRRGLLTVAVLASALNASATPQTLPRDVAAEFGNLHIYYNDRICPLQTLARDFTAKLYGKTSYEGLTAEQVLTGWFFYYDDWKHEPMIKIKGSAMQDLLQIEGQYAALTDFTDYNGYRIDEALQSGNDALRRNAESANEKFNLVSMLCTGSLLKIYPYNEPDSEQSVWYSLADQLPRTMPYEQWLFIGNSLNLVAEQVARRDYTQVTTLVDKIRQYQLREAPTAVPEPWLFRAEQLYNESNYNRPLAMACLTLGIICFMLFVMCDGAKRPMRWLRFALLAIVGCIVAYLTFHIALRWMVSGHVPLSNGFETMQFMAWCSVVLTLLFANRFRLALPFGLLLCGFTMLVAMMGEATPKITQLMPVLQSPLLSIHVVVIMIAYTLLAFTMLNGLTALIIRRTRPEAEQEIESLYILSRLMLYPAVFLLAAGIFIGAVWANISWGRYWGWDPKEVWALITMLVYASALHSQSLGWFRRPIFFHTFCIVAFLTVIVTYFGVNFLLGGMHSYA
ncbi:MAG: cytochrome c biogenesis protein CcsA [Alistipes sp.]|nr:cytochrome c biogenesis protein CcsA [Alistipes sp.]